MNFDREEAGLNENNFIYAVKYQLKKQLDEEYTKRKEELLRKFNDELESKRNNIVGDILNAIDIELGRTPMGMACNISFQKIIKVEKNER